MCDRGHPPESSYIYTYPANSTDPGRQRLFCRDCRWEDRNGKPISERRRRVDDLGRPLCKWGHPLTGDNVRFDSRGHRVCIECKRNHHYDYVSRQQMAAIMGAGAIIHWFWGYTDTELRWLAECYNEERAKRTVSFRRRLQQRWKCSIRETDRRIAAIHRAGLVIPISKDHRAFSMARRRAKQGHTDKCRVKCHESHSEPSPQQVTQMEKLFYLEYSQAKPVITASQIKSFREAVGWTRSDLAERLNVPQTTIQSWERGNHAPNRRNAIRLRSSIIETARKMGYPG